MGFHLWYGVVTTMWRLLSSYHAGALFSAPLSSLCSSVSLMKPGRIIDMLSNQSLSVSDSAPVHHHLLETESTVSITEPKVWNQKLWAHQGKFALSFRYSFTKRCFGATIPWTLSICRLETLAVLLSTMGSCRHQILKRSWITIQNCRTAIYRVAVEPKSTTTTACDCLHSLHLRLL